VGQAQATRQPELRVLAATPVWEVFQGQRVVQARGRQRAVRVVVVSSGLQWGQWQRRGLAVPQVDL